MFLRGCLGKPSIMTLHFYAMPFFFPPEQFLIISLYFTATVTPTDWAGACNPFWKTRKEPEVKGGEAKGREVSLS